MDGHQSKASREVETEKRDTESSPNSVTAAHLRMSCGVRPTPIALSWKLVTFRGAAGKSVASQKQLRCSAPLRLWNCGLVLPSRWSPALTRKRRLLLDQSL